ncbi:MAG: hypothetical protein KatS3mg009_1383 [Acidimicrobiia bacterium]|nr:MAG: hypothetical protein KatS3mg009_1383 [Acidimicrobiia bacterium]
MWMSPSPWECTPAVTLALSAALWNSGAFGSQVPHTFTPKAACQ